MNPENIVERCRDCPNLQPYVLDVNLIGAKIVELMALQVDLNEPYDDFTFKLNRLTDSLEESQRALEEAHAVTTGCPGVDEKDGKIACQSPLEPAKISDDIF